MDTSQLRALRSEKPFCSTGAPEGLDKATQQTILAERMLCRTAVSGCQDGHTPCTDRATREKLVITAKRLVAENPDVDLAPSAGSEEATKQAMVAVNALVKRYAEQLRTNTARDID